MMLFCQELAFPQSRIRFPLASVEPLHLAANEDRHFLKQGRMPSSSQAYSPPMMLLERRYTTPSFL